MPTAVVPSLYKLRLPLYTSLLTETGSPDTVLDFAYREGANILVFIRNGANLAQ
jgi:hypothetical protein